MPEISLIVATIGREAELRRLFDSFLKESYVDYEVIIVDQSDFELRKKVAQIVVDFSHLLPLKHITDDGKGLSRARNIGLRIARGRIIGFPDDDCWYSGNILESVKAFFDTHLEMAIVAGPYSEPGRNNPSFPQRKHALTLNNFFGSVSSVGTFINKSALCDSDIFFDECIGAGTDMPVGEETDFIMRLLCANARGQFMPDIIVYHAILREKAVSNAAIAALRLAFWYIIGKNYRIFWSEARILRGLAGCILKPQPLKRSEALQVMLKGFFKGFKKRLSEPPAN